MLVQRISSNAGRTGRADDEGLGLLVLQLRALLKAALRTLGELAAEQV